MLNWKSRLIAFSACFGIGLALALLINLTRALPETARQKIERLGTGGRKVCGGVESFQSPEVILSALRHGDVSIRREVFRRLFLRPGVTTSYYDYERDRDYPERAEQAEVRYLNLDDESETEAVLTFLRYEHPVALILKKDECGWRLAGALSAWLRYEDYPYQDWLELPETIRQGVHEILVRDSNGDATRYRRNARLLKLRDGALTQIAEFTEESINPVDGYRAPDWSDVKGRVMRRLTFLPESDGKAARLSLSSEEELVLYSGALEAYTYWLETDGAWHNARRHWRERKRVRLRLLDRKERDFVWDAQRQKFIEAG
jgi:hypothetical protein